MQVGAPAAVSQPGASPDADGRGPARTERPASPPPGPAAPAGAVSDGEAVGGPDGGDRGREGVKVPCRSSVPTPILTRTALSLGVSPRGAFLCHSVPFSQAKPAGLVTENERVLAP